jgi:hypothetical protein
VKAVFPLQGTQLSKNLKRFLHPSSRVFLPHFVLALAPDGISQQKFSNTTSEDNDGQQRQGFDRQEV